MFETFSKATGLDAASRAACEGRLEALALIYDLAETPTKGKEVASPESVRASYELLRRKSMAILQASQPAESFCFLGLEVARRLPQVLKNRLGGRETSEVFTVLSGGENRLLAQSVVRALGIDRSPDAIRRTLGALRSQLSMLARKA
jgi:hypothetical protein